MNSVELRLRATQFTILATLIQTGSIPISRLAGFLGVQRTTLTRNLRPLEKRKLVALGGQSDGRIHEVRVTSAGITLARALLPRWKQAQASVGEVLSRFDLTFTSTK